MRKQFRRMTGVLLAVIIMLGGISIAPLTVSAVSKTADDAISWCQSKLGQGVEYSIDEYRYQCVDFIQAYYSYLGVSPSWGSGYQYAENTLPAGWTRTYGGKPQKGDILVYTGGYGHVAIYESDYVSYHQNWSGSYVQRVERYYGDSVWVSAEGVTKTYWGCIHPNFVNDTSAPTISNARAENVSGSSFTIKCDLYDNVGVTRVWVVLYGPHGESQFSVPASNGTFSHTINTADYGGPGEYAYGFYAQDAAGNSTKGLVEPIHAINDTVAPTISNARAENVSGSSFNIKCDLYDNVGVTRVWVVLYGPHGESQFSVPASNGEFSHTINTADYGGPGEYAYGFYAQDAAGNSTKELIEPIYAYSDTAAPIISNARAENASGSSFDIKCDLYDNVGVSRIWFIVYGPHGESQFGVPAANGSFSYTFNTSDYGGPGEYAVGFYAFDAEEHGTKCVVEPIHAVNDTISPIISNARAENISGSSFDIKCDLNDNVGVSRIWFVVYGPHGESQFGVPASNGSFTYTFNTTDFGGSGEYAIGFYAFDQAENGTKGLVKSIYARDYSIGDTNLDGHISIGDVTAIQRQLAELAVFNDEQLALADANGDGEINISDATHLQMYIAEYDVKLG